MTGQRPGPPLHILLVEDDAGIGRVLTNGLRDKGIELDWQRSGAPALQRLQESRFDAVILDLMLPDMSGFDLCLDIRAGGNTTPICMLTARDALEDKLEGFDAGADDYIGKPFSIDELAARLKALVRRSQQDPYQSSLSAGVLRIDLAARELRANDCKVALTRREFDVLVVLARNERKVVSREQLLQAVWGADRDVTPNTVDVYIGYLRRKLGEVKDAPGIDAVRGIGFKLC